MSAFRQLQAHTGDLLFVARGPAFLALGLLVLLWIGISFHLQGEQLQAERGAILNSENLASAFEEHLSRSLNEIDRALKITRANYELDPDRFGFKDWLKTSQLFDDQTVQASIIGADGRIKQSTVDDPSAIGTDIGDREHFRVQVDAQSDELFISKPVRGRTTGKLSIQLSRRIANKDGSFAGVIVASLDPAYLARFYSSVDIGKYGFVRVLGTDGILRAAGGRSSLPLGANLFAGREFNPNKASGWYYTPSGLSDHIPRLVTFRAVRNYPLIITIGVSTQEVFSDVEANRRTYYLVALAVTLLVLTAAGFSIRWFLLRDRMAKDRQTQALRFDTVLRNMPLGVCMMDAQGCLAVCNEQFYRMYDLSADFVKPGTPFLELIRARKAAGTFAGDPQKFCRDVADQLNDGLLMKFSTPLEDGRIISVVNQPMKGGGWISIHEDTTEQTIAKKELEQTKTFLDSIIENVPAPIVVKSANTGTFILVNRAYEALVGVPRDHLIGKTVFDIFPADNAERISQTDRDAIHSKRPLTSEDHSLKTPRSGTRIISTNRLVVRDRDDKAEYLIIVIDDVTEKKKAYEKIAFMAHHDALTGLSNRAQFVEQLDRSLNNAPGSKQLAVHFLDLDLFKDVNDTLGHMIGDELLKVVAERLQGCIGASDTVARLGGDEFGIIQSAVEQPADMSLLADRIRTAIRAPYDLGGLNANVDVSIGIARAPSDGTTSAELIKRADLAVYRAKAEGRGAHRFFEPAMDAEMKARRRLENDLRAALINGDFRLFYQPIVSIASNGIVGFEALLRWPHPTLGLVPPSDFIPAAEETGLIVQLGEWVMRQACSDASHWPDNIKIAVNMSPTQFASQNLAQVVTSALATSHMAPDRLELEITEEVLLAHNNENIAVLNQLRQLGVQIVMDDFGTGYSSLNYLRSLPFDKIKIDRSFVRDLTDGDNLSFEIVRAVASLAAILKVPTTAEGIETEKQLQLVREAGCTQFQGYLFSTPKPFSEIIKLFPKLDRDVRYAAHKARLRRA
jgi:diguanylate cyclase (GGDEF)-like protein/PAS domain S-box-containing protein